MIEWSPTRVAATFCMRYYEFLYVLGIRMPKDINLVFGEVLHKLVALFWHRNFEKKTKDGKLPEEKFINQFSYFYKKAVACPFCGRVIERGNPYKWGLSSWKSLREICENFDKIENCPERRKVKFERINFKSDELPIILHWDGRHILRKFYKANIEIKKSEPAPISEKTIRFRLDSKKFRVKIDEIRAKDGKVIIRDYKSSRFIREKPIEDLQLVFYQMAVALKLKEDENFRESLGFSKKRSFDSIFNSLKTELYFLRENKISEVKCKKGDFRDILMKIEEAEANIRKGLFSPILKDEVCKNCEYRELCKKMREKEELNFGQIELFEKEPTSRSVKTMKFEF